MGFLELLFVRLVLWFGAPLSLVILLVGPARFARGLRRGWDWLWEKRLDPREVLTRVVRQHEELVRAQRGVIAQAEAAEQEVARNIRKSEESLRSLEQEADRLVRRSDDLGARAVLYKMNLEHAALGSFRHQLEQQRRHVAEARRRLYLLELQLRQYEVGRSVLLSQLAEAQTLEQQYAIASRFDPFSAVANWQQAEGMVQEKASSARAAEQVFHDTAEAPLAGQPAPIDPAVLEAQLQEMKARLGRGGARENGHTI